MYNVKKCICTIITQTCNSKDRQYSGQKKKGKQKNKGRQNIILKFKS